MKDVTELAHRVAGAENTYSKGTCVLLWNLPHVSTPSCVAGTVLSLQDGETHALYPSRAASLSVPPAAPESPSLPRMPQFCFLGEGLLPEATG